MKTESQVRLVVAHAECRGRDDGLEFVAPQLMFNFQAVGSFHLPGVGRNIKTAFTKKGGDSLSFGNGECVDNARARQRSQGVGDPGEAFCGGEPRDDRESKRSSCESAAKHCGAGAQLSSDVIGDSLVGSRGGGEDSGVSCGEESASDSLIIRAKIKTPVADTVGFVNDDEGSLSEQLRQPLCEGRVAESFG